MKTSVWSSSRFGRAAVAGLVACVCVGGVLPVRSAEPAAGQNDGVGNDTDEVRLSYPELVRADRPVAWWRFDGKAPLTSAADPAVAGAELTGEAVGGVRLEAPGPRPERYPLFDDENGAAWFSGGRGFLRVKDPGPNSVLKFEQGDSITLEAWVHVQSVGNGANVYLVGKGRTNNQGFPRENQNYALRLVGKGPAACVSFLFRNADNRSGNRNDFHRWISDAGFPVGSGWHHVAVTYTFGKKESLRGYIDGHPVEGTWDMGGASDKPPVVDDDELWIGAALGGSGSNTFHGLMDEVAIYRTALPPERIKKRFQVVGGVEDSTPESSMPPAVADADLPERSVLVEILEGVPDQRSWAFPPFAPPQVIESYVEPAFAFHQLTRKYSDKGVQIDRSNPIVVRATGRVELPAGEHRFLLRSRNAARLHLDGEKVLETPFFNIVGTAHGKIRKVAKVTDEGLRPLQTGDSENVTTITTQGGVHRIELEFFVGGGNRRPETGETLVAFAPPGEPFRLLSPAVEVTLTDEAWLPFAAETRRRLTALNAERRREAGVAETEYWNRRHELARRTLVDMPAPAVPQVARVPVHNAIDRFIGSKLEKQGTGPAPLTDDWAFLRRVTLDLIGTVPTPEQIAEFSELSSGKARGDWIDRLLEHPGWADHWVGYWQDVLAENPNIVNPTLNNTGPFRWWIHESFLDNKPFDRFVTELVLMEGSTHYGGPAGFELATQNDAPMAEKAHILSQAFLGIEMKCARCHDAPYHDLKQRDLFSVAAMLKRGAQPVPKTSSIPLPPEALESLMVKVTLKPGSNVPPEWPFEQLAAEEFLAGVLRNPADPRDRLAALITSPHNERFARVIVNRLWQRYMGRGLVEPVDDWEHANPSHPELLDWLARELVTSGYDLRHVARLILNSHAYQRTATSDVPLNHHEPFHFAAPVRRRMTAEQIVDSLFTAAGKEFHAGDMNIDADGARAYTSSLNLGTPERAWQFTSLSNERDRPSLSLPLADGFLTLLETFGWRASRQNPVSVREEETTVLQPAILSNGLLAQRFTRLSEDSAFAQLALEDQPLDKLIDRIFLRALTRPPTAEERELFTDLLRDGYPTRRREARPEEIQVFCPPTTGVSWSNHLSPEANEVMVALERLVRAGDPPTPRLAPDWRERLEDMLWALLNTPEFVFVP